MEHREQLRTLVRVMRETCNVSAAARVVGISRKTAYQWRTESLEDPTRHVVELENFEEMPLHEAWEDAIGEAVDELEAEDMRRGKGFWRPVYHQGVPVYRVDPVTKQYVLDEAGNPVREVEWVYDGQAVDRQLKAHRPEKYRERRAVELSGEVKTPGAVVVVPGIASSEEWERILAQHRRERGLDP
jgi:hypothetical protein